MEEEVWLQHKDRCALFDLEGGRLDVKVIAKVWNLDPSSLVIASRVVKIGENGLSTRSIDAFWDVEEGCDGRSKAKALPVIGQPLADDDMRIKRDKLCGVDKSKEWATSVLTPFDYGSIAESFKLKEALNEPLHLKIPISSELYKRLEPPIVEYFISADEYKADTISAHVTLFLSEGMQGSESLLQSHWDLIFATFWKSLLRLTESNMITYDRNVTDTSGASTTGKRPDLLLWSMGRLVAKFEEKKESLHEAYEDLRKLCALPTRYYGPVDWIIGVALTGADMCVWTMKQGSPLDTLCGPLQMKYPSSMYMCILVSVNLLRIALTLKNVFSSLPFTPRPWVTLPSVTYGKLGSLTRTITIVWPYVSKSIKPWSSHVAEGFTTWEYVNAAYSLVVPELINGECVLYRNDVYKVKLNVVGYEEEVISEYAMRGAIKAVLHALKALHHEGLVHRDVRWKNILRKDDGGWMLIDLETVWKSGQKPKCMLKAWDNETLDDGKYTDQSDLYLVGKLMQKLPGTGHSLRRKLLKHEYKCAEDALEDDWLYN